MIHPSQVLPYITLGSTTFLNASLAVDVADILSYVAPAPGSQRSGLIRVHLGSGPWGFWG